MKKLLVVGVIALFIGMTISSSIGFNLEKQSTVTILGGNTFYVGGSGSGNYTKIQDAIDDASDGDTVFVYDDSSPYYEFLTINNTINLIGENKETTIINGQGEYKIIIIINAEDCLIKGFNIQDTKNSGIVINISSGCEITENIIFNCSFGISVFESNNCIVSNNHFIQCTFSHIGIYKSKYCTVICNIFEKGGSLLSAVHSDTSSDNNFTHNLIKNCIIGMMFYDTQNWSISYNTFKNNIAGIILSYSWDNVFSNNNFQFNFIRNVLVMGRMSKNEWSGNYWNRPRFLPKLIRGWGWTSDDYPIPYPMLLFFGNIDWNPALSPYDIGV